MSTNNHSEIDVLLARLKAKIKRNEELSRQWDHERMLCLKEIGELLLAEAYGRGSTQN